MSEEIDKLEDALKIKIVAGLEFINFGYPFHKIDLNKGDFHTRKTIISDRN